MDDKLLIGILGVVAGGSFTIIASYLSARYRMKELEYKLLQRSAMGRLSAARSKLNDIYLPINEKIEALYGAYEKYYKSKSQEHEEGLFSSFESLSTVYDDIKRSGNTMFIVSEIHDELEHLITLVNESRSASKIYSVVISKVEMLGLRAASKRIYPQWIATVLYLVLVLISKMRILIRFSASMYFVDTEIRTYSAPINSEDFRSEFLLCVSAIRSRSKDIALSEAISEAELVPVG